MSAQARFTTSRGKLGSPIVMGSEARRPVLVCLRDTEVDTTVADKVAMDMATICAQALNRADAEERWRKGQGRK